MDAPLAVLGAGAGAVILGAVYHTQLYGGPHRSREERERRIQCANELLAGAGVAAGLAMAGVGAWQSCRHLSGWYRDRKEDLTRIILPFEEKYRQRRVRSWRHSLPPNARADWGAVGLLGPDLRGVVPTQYSRVLEAALVGEQEGGPAVFQRELIWMRSVSGEWVTVPAILDNDNVAGLGIPVGIAQLLGYATEAGQPVVPGVGAPLMQIARGHARILVHTLPMMLHSIAGIEMAWPTYMLPPPLQAEQDEEERVLVPQEALQYLQQRGVAFRLAWP